LIKSLNFVQNLPKLKLQLLSRFTIVVFLFSTFNLFSQSLILNEVSQGPSGSKEYIELLVIPGTSPYNCTNYCLDLRNWVLDDNNGYFSGGATSGVGIANGAVRFKNDPFWQCIPIGTLIVIYNDLDPNASLPANDISTTDGNCSIVIPVTSSLLEHQTTSPTPSASTYPSSGWITGGLWGPISMANGTFSTGVFTNGDSFQVYNPSNLTTPIHGVSWANNNVNNIIYFNSLATNSVFYFGNTIDNNPSNQANWISGTCSVPNNQTPGLPNNAANATFISSLNNNCAGPLVITLIGSTDASSCLCNGQASVNASGSIPGYTYAWYNSSFVSIGQNTASATNLCAGTYYCIVSSSINCTDTLLVTINNTVTSITPSFNPIAPICAGGTINLPTTSTNGITGSWSPAVDNTQTTTYTFTPTGGQCATTTTLQVSVGAPQTPTFATVGPYCAGASFSLPTSSIEGFTGSWSPAINTTTTTSYSFTPTSGQCATTANLSVPINPIPTVSILENPTICAGQSTVLTTSTSIPGGSFAWNPGGQLTPTITVNPASSTNYTVIYSVSGCASLPASSSVTVNAITTPTFNPIAPICAGGTINLPTTSTNGITGSWSPAVNNTQTTTYTFTPTGGQCATTTTLQVSVGAPQTPTFAIVGPYCAGASFSLPTSSIEGFTGSWSPAINTTTTTSYSFTPTSGQCATTANLSVTINPIPTVSILENPTICTGQSTVLTTSTSIPGGTFAWNPGGQTTPTITVNPASSTNYTVIYSVSGCTSLPANSSVTVNNSIIPQFASWGPFCQDALLAQVILPETSINGITGSWNPQMVSTATAGISTYTFTPTAGQCASDFQLLVEVFATPIIFGGNDITICAGNSITLSATGGAQYTWSNSVQNGIPFQAISSSIYSVSAIDANGCEGFDTVNITVLESPIAAFAPDVTTGIAPLTVQFINTSTNATSYLWDFGNGNTLAVSNTNTVETTYLSAQTYEVWLVASNGFCADSALATIIVLPAGAPEIVIPNVFTPNGDVTNDEWIIQTTNIASIEIVILNRWGNVMAEITDLATGWDGKKTNGDDATDGTYFYKYTAKALNGENLSGHGFLTLIR
jgi:gliding motility-associated-like protein